jgi:sugar phosphate isomerase/epimerase
LAVENHKDWFAAEHIELLNRIGSEWIGALVDVGNGVSLLEDPYEVVETLSPVAVSTHIKDMGVREYDEGFLLSEVPLGAGFLDLPRMVARLKKANAQIHFNLEMITRDPLKVPCFTDAYYTTFERARASDLAATIAVVRKHSSANLPTTNGLSASERVAFEDKNVRLSLEWAAKNLA